MKKKLKKGRLRKDSPARKGLLFMAVSWLVARLWWSLEISRLTILRIRPQAVMSQVSRDEGEFPGSRWVLQERGVYCVGLNRRTDELIIRETSTMELN